MTIFLNVILPVFLVGGCGYLVGRFVRSEPLVLTRIIFYLLTPALIFRFIYTSTISFDSALSIGGYIILIQLSMFAISRIVGRFRRWDADSQAAGSLVLLFANCGNYGLPVMLFAFGEEGFAFGIIFVIVSNMMQATIGISVASWQKDATWKQGLTRVLRYPHLYAFALAMVMRSVPAGIPESLFRSIDLLAQAAIPGQLLMLGLQLSRVRLHHFGLDSILLSSIKLLVPPLLGWGVTSLLGISGLLQAVLIAEASMPSAVNSLILATQFRRNPELAATTVFVSTVFSLVTITVLLTVLG
ncbi:AEC family transporter [Candidatus Bipolaricaulota bacterium]|nr:AEC family transporter [Candidatus Bipolaricaulota bacterium]